MIEASCVSADAADVQSASRPFFFFLFFFFPLNCSLCRRSSGSAGLSSAELPKVSARPGRSASQIIHTRPAKIKGFAELQAFVNERRRKTMSALASTLTAAAALSLAATLG